MSHSSCGLCCSAYSCLRAGISIDGKRVSNRCERGDQKGSEEDNKSMNNRGGEWCVCQGRRCVFGKGGSRLGYTRVATGAVEGRVVVLRGDGCCKQRRHGARVLARRHLDTPSTVAIGWVRALLDELWRSTRHSATAGGIVHGSETAHARYSRPHHTHTPRPIHMPSK